MGKKIILDAARLVGGVVAMSLALGKSRAAVSQWDQVPDSEVLKVSRITGHKITPHALRPDLYPNPADALPADIAEKVLAGQWPPIPNDLEAA